MPRFKRSDYGSNPHAGKSRNNAPERGWGSGWPHCQYSNIVRLTHDGIAINLRREIAELVGTLLEATENVHGYEIRGNSASEWNTGSFSCRPIRGTDVASNHSWGLAVDVNANRNPMGTRFVSDIPPAVVTMWEDSGFYWGGRYRNRPDAMHFEYIFTPDDVAEHLEIASEVMVDEPDEGRSYDPYRNVSPGRRTIQRWSAGRDVEFVQRFIGRPQAGPPDGYFGTLTEQGVIWYQRMRGIVVDGIVGPQTWRHMGQR